MYFCDSVEIQCLVGHFQHDFGKINFVGEEEKKYFIKAQGKKGKSKKRFINNGNDYINQSYCIYV